MVDRKYYFIYILIVFGIMAFFGLYVLLAPIKTYSENENRYLNTLPKLEKETVFSGKFQDDADTAFSDQFFARDFWMKTATMTKLISGLKETTEAYFGKDGYFFARTREQDIDQKQYLKNLRYVEFLGAVNPEKVSLILVPSPATILKDKLPNGAPYYNASAMYEETETILKETKAIDVYTQMEEYAKQNQVYFKTDHHWTLLGAYAAYSAYCEQTKQQKHTYGFFSVKKISDSFYGTMYSKVLYPFTKPDDLYAAVNVPQAEVICDGEAKKGVYDVEQLMKKDKYAYFFGGNYGEVEIKSHSDGTGRLLVIKDSFANCFVPFVMDNYAEVTMLDLRYYKESVLQKISEGGYDRVLVLYEMSNFANDTNLYKLTH